MFGGSTGVSEFEPKRHSLPLCGRLGNEDSAGSTWAVQVRHLEAVKASVGPQAVRLLGQHCGDHILQSDHRDALMARWLLQDFLAEDGLLRP